MTQMTNQTYTDPFLAIVVCITSFASIFIPFISQLTFRLIPTVLLALEGSILERSGLIQRYFDLLKAAIQANRVTWKGYTTSSAGQSEYQSIPLNKIEDFGSHASQYYPLEISHFKSSLDSQILDLLWNKYWVMTLSQSSLITVGIYQLHRLLVSLMHSPESWIYHFTTLWSNW
jgi:hypothetical protein